MVDLTALIMSGGGWTRAEQLEHQLLDANRKVYVLQAQVRRLRLLAVALVALVVAARLLP